MEPSIYGSADSRHPPTCDIDASVHSEEGADGGEEKIDNAVDDTNSPSDQRNCDGAQCAQHTPHNANGSSNSPDDRKTSTVQVSVRLRLCTMKTRVLT